MMMIKPFISDLPSELYATIFQNTIKHKLLTEIQGPQNPFKAISETHYRIMV
jgi:hypothetical protein